MQDKEDSGGHFHHKHTHMNEICYKLHAMLYKSTVNVNAMLW